MNMKGHWVRHKPEYHKGRPEKESNGEKYPKKASLVVTNDFKDGLQDILYEIDTNTFLSQVYFTGSSKE